MKTLVVATRNRGKLGEIAAMLPQYDLQTLDDIGFEDDIPEPYHTFKENAFTKAATVFKFCGQPVLADDSGLCIPALEGRPGVDSAVYAGEPRSDARNIEKVLTELGEAARRDAYFISVICYIDEWGPRYFEGRCEGSITKEIRGSKGFGYDPVFVPAGFSQTLAELEPEIKNSVSHRGSSIAALAAFLRGEEAP